MPRSPLAWFWILALIAGGVGVHLQFWPYDTTGQDVYYTWLEGDRLLRGENPYARVLDGDMRVNDKYATYFPGFYLLSAGSQLLGYRAFEDWVSFWRPVFLGFNLLIAVGLFVAFERRGRAGLGLFAAAFWLLNRWTLYVSRVAHIEFIPIVLLIAALLLTRRRRVLAAYLFGASLAIKQIAIFLVPLFLIFAWQESARDRVRRTLWTGVHIAAIPTVLSLPFLIWNAEGFVKSIVFSATRAPDGHIQGLQSLDALIGMKVPEFVGLPAKLPMLGIMAFVFWLAWRRRIGPVVAGLLLLTVFVAFNSVLFMQYFCWLIPLAFLALLEREGTPEDDARTAATAG